MANLPNVCVIDENPRVQVGWKYALDSQANLFYYRDPRELLKEAASDRDLLASFCCVVIGRYFSHMGFDVVDTDFALTIRARACCPVFLNWQGFVDKRDLNRQFDGKIFQRYGVKWHTLRLRIQRIYRQKTDLERKVKITEVSPPRGGAKRLVPASACPINIAAASNVHPVANIMVPPSAASVLPLCAASASAQLPATRTEKCQELLQSMARRAEGRHREFIQDCASDNIKQGIALLEAIYNRLISYKEQPSNCPSRYINSSPIIAARILQQTLQIQ